jgi:hypothetical protein
MVRGMIRGMVKVSDSAFQGGRCSLSLSLSLSLSFSLSLGKPRLDPYFQIILLTTFQ